MIHIDSGPIPTRYRPFSLMIIVFLGFKWFLMYIEYGFVLKNTYIKWILSNGGQTPHFNLWQERENLYVGKKDCFYSFITAKILD